MLRKGYCFAIQALKFLSYAEKNFCNTDLGQKNLVE